MDETLDSSEDYSDVSGIVISGLSGNDSGGDPVEGVRVRLLSVEEPLLVGDDHRF